jgi:hypothetical protein
MQEWTPEGIEQHNAMNAICKGQQEKIGVPMPHEQHAACELLPQICVVSEAILPLHANLIWSKQLKFLERK